MTHEQEARIAKISRDPIALHDVDSSQIARIGHDAGSNTLAIQFHPRAGESEGSVYHYSDVDRGIFDELRNARSIGSYFYKTIKPDAVRFPFVKVAEAKKRHAA